MVELPLAVVLLCSGVQPSATPPAADPPTAIPAIARQLPATWPPPGWPTRVTLPGEKPAQSEQAAKPAEKDLWVTVFPHVRLNRALKAVEFDGVVAWDFHNADTPRTELELLVCLPLRDKEHESLVLSKAKGSDVHAALLMTGLEPGAPGRIEFGAGKDGQLKRYAPIGPTMNVTFRYDKNGNEVVADPRDWFIDEVGEREWREYKADRAAKPHRLGDTRAFDDDDRYPLQLVFGGSKIGKMRGEDGKQVEVYNADSSGALIGLCTFGSETIGNGAVVSPDSGVDAPRFVAKNEAIPSADTPIRVRMEPKPGLIGREPPAWATMPDGSNKARSPEPPNAAAPRP